MKNFLTFRIESWLGSVFVLSFAAFMVGLFLVAMKNFDSESKILDYTNLRLQTVSPQERALIDEWLKTSEAELSQDGGYRSILRKYPDRPWRNLGN